MRHVGATAQVNMHEAKTHLSALVERVIAGEQITIARAGVPVADLVPHRERTVVFGVGKGTFTFDEEAFKESDALLRQLFYGTQP